MCRYNYLLQLQRLATANGHKMSCTIVYNVWSAMEPNQSMMM